jgi:uncharacterized protein (DUF1501 family)
LPSSAGADAATVVDELALVLTQDRLHPETRAAIAAEYAAVAGTSGAGAALKLAQKLMLMAPEVQVSSLNTINDKPHPTASQVVSAGRPYKAIVVVFMNGGCDSWNVL